jgi:tetratricopeptide (TPR) repeat protein
MSLLLEALKKAEKAKEDALRRERGEPAAAELRIVQDEPAPEARPITRAELPDIKQPLEILSDEIAAKEAAPPPPPPRAAAARPEAPKDPAPQAAERAAAKKVFEAKFREPNPRLPFFIALGVLGAFALGTIGYFWYQLRPPPPLVNLNPGRPAAEAPAPAAVVRAPAPPAAPPAAQSTLPGLPTAAAAPAPRPIPEPRTIPAPRAIPQPRAEEPAAPPRPRPAPRIARPAPAEPAQPPAASVSTHPAPAPQIHPKVQTAYAAYQQGDLAAARSDYQEALREQATNRDALLGLAAIDVRSGRLEAAEATYLRLLQLDPNDAHAQAGLIALRASRLDPLATESRVKNMLAADPGAHVLHFTLGNQLAQQSRWEEAQQEYFKAFAASPDNADFAYNLAVSLDHLRQRRPALEYYRRAVALAEKRGGSFDVAAARRRAAELER